MENFVLIDSIMALVALLIVTGIPSKVHSPKVKLVNHGITVKDVNFAPVNLLDIVYDKDKH